MKQEIQSQIHKYNLIEKEVDDLYRSVAKGYGFSDCAFWIIYILRQGNKNYTQSELCGEMFECKQTVNSALKKLESEGYLELRHTSNMKNKQIYLTEKGKKSAKASADKVIEGEYRAFESLSDEERTAFLDIYKKLVVNLQKEMKGLRNTD